MPKKGENIFKRKDGRWEARYIHHYEGGKAKYRYVYGTTYAEAKAKKDAGRSMALSGRSIPAGRAETFEILVNAWLPDIKFSVRESTYSRYHRIVTKYLLPLMKGYEIEKIDQKYLNELTVILLSRGGVRGKGLAPKTVTDILCVLKTILKYGSENNFPCQNISRLKYPQRKSRNMKVLTDESRAKIERCLLESNDNVSLGILFTLFTGVRIGELCGLRWADIDFVNATVSICRTVERISDLDPHSSRKTKVIMSEPKTESSIRVIPLPSFLMEYLKKCRRGSDCYLLTGNKNYTEPHQYYVRYRKYLKRNGIGSYTFHTLRHTFATRCIEMGFDTKSLSEILGHSSITTTLSVYVHPSMQQKKAQMEKLMPGSI
ncbi:MAG: site-specific integrase [Lachnospiraceae bacterium]|nr:site-specific integrase [Lachnospiraceae bacterium]